MRNMIRCALSALLFLGTACGGDAARDLDRAVNAFGQRALSEPVVEASGLAWTDLRAETSGGDSILLRPQSLCFLGDRLLVADMGTSRVDWFDASLNYLGGMGRDGEGPGEFRQLMVVRCKDDGSGFLTVDQEARKLSFFDAKGGFMRSVEVPPVPQGIPFVGEFGFATDGTWFDSWFNMSIGPYLQPEEWAGVDLIRRWSEDGEEITSFGEPAPYENVVVRRVFNQVSMDVVQDTVWMITEGDAAIQGFDLEGRPVTRRILLPVYHRGDDPVVLVKSPLPNGLRSNRAVYEKNVSGVAALEGGRFAVLRFQDWRRVERGEGNAAYTDLWPRSFLDVILRDGSVEASYELPGRARVVTSDHVGRVAVITEDFDTLERSVLAASLPGMSRYRSPVILAAAEPVAPSVERHEVTSIRVSGARTAASGLQ